MSRTVPELKAILRRRLLAEAERHSPAERIAGSEQMCQELLRQPRWHKSRSVLGFAPTPMEPDLRSVLMAALDNGKTVALPRYMAAQSCYEACQIYDLAADVQPGRFGILEPRSACPAFPLNRLDFILVPGLAFDMAGRRLGRGKGYFDRLLAPVRGFKCAAAFEWQIVDIVPAERHDIHVDCILTPIRWQEVVSAGRF